MVWLLFSLPYLLIKNGDRVLFRWILKSTLSPFFLFYPDRDNSHSLEYKRHRQLIVYKG